jgi:hypothetical protein
VAGCAARVAGLVSKKIAPAIELRASEIAADS